MKKDCKDVRNVIQTHLDRESALPNWVLEHLKRCKSCSFFKESLESYSKKLKISLDEEIRTLTSPDISSILEKKSKKKRYAKLVQLIAAVFLFIVISIFGYRRYSSYKTKSFLKYENSTFIAEIFNQSIFEEANSINGLTYSTEWFESPGEFSDFIEVISLTTDTY